MTMKMRCMLVEKEYSVQLNRRGPVDRKRDTDEVNTSLRNIALVCIYYHGIKQWELEHLSRGPKLDFLQTSTE